MICSKVTLIIAIRGLNVLDYNTDPTDLAESQLLHYRLMILLHGFPFTGLIDSIAGQLLHGVPERRIAFQLCLDNGHGNAEHNGLP
jgi:hypothetical protein